MISYLWRHDLILRHTRTKIVQNRAQNALQLFILFFLTNYHLKFKRNKKAHGAMTFTVEFSLMRFRVRYSKGS